MAIQIGFDWGIRELIGHVVSYIDEHYPRVVSADNKRHFLEVKARYFLQAPASDLGLGGLWVVDVSSKLLLFMVNYNELGAVPNGCKEPTTLILNHSIHKLLRYVRNRVKMERHHA